MYVFKIVLLFLMLYLKDASAVCDKFALSSVDALTYTQRNTRAIIHRKENFNTLDTYISVDVIGSNVSELCEGMIKNFPILERLNFINANLTHIEPGAFQNVPKLKSLSLSVNQLKHIPRGVFNVVKSFKIIYLTRNQIETIEDAAFAEMPNLKAVHLDHNKIKELSGNIFFGSPVISLVDFSYNQLSYIDKKGFDDLRPTTSIGALNILLKKNKIQDISSDALVPLIAVNLHLEGNEISRISHIAHSVKENSHIYVANNIIQCIPDDVLNLVKVSDIRISAKNNPMLCECMERVDNLLAEYIKGELDVVTTMQCDVNYQF